MRRRPAAVLAACALAALLAACQQVDPDGEPAAVDDTAAVAPEEVIGNPEEDWPRTLPALQALADQEALAWQEQPVLADVTVWLDAEGTWERARLTYVAPAADRMLTYTTSPEDLRVERPALAGLQLPALPPEAVDELQPLPADVLEPAALAAASAEALAGCDVAGQPVRAVLYATGAPAAWDGSAWSRTPTWRATVVAEGGGVVVEPTTGRAFAPLTCVEPLLLQGG